MANAVCRVKTLTKQEKIKQTDKETIIKGKRGNKL
jgi:hypothetical protein